ncbi:MAG: STAS domain-containing protein [Thermodesulfobacteriota bacterium]|nr:STAS domain-containing protein [Thermodesulfobacteriota bacterium]
MLNIHKEPAGDGAIVLKLEGDATIEYAEQLHQVLLETLREIDQLSVDLEQVTSCDFYILQLLCSAHRTAMKWKKHLSFHGIPSPVVRETIFSTGFLRNHGCSLSPDVNDCLWIGHHRPPSD